MILTQSWKGLHSPAHADDRSSYFRGQTSGQPRTECAVSLRNNAGHFMLLQRRSSRLADTVGETVIVCQFAIRRNFATRATHEQRRITDWSDGRTTEIRLFPSWKENHSSLIAVAMNGIQRIVVALLNVQC